MKIEAGDPKLYDILRKRGHITNAIRNGAEVMNLSTDLWYALRDKGLITKKRRRRGSLYMESELEVLDIISDLIARRFDVDLKAFKERIIDDEEW